MLLFAMSAPFECMVSWIVRMFIVIMTIMIIMLKNVIMRMKERQRRTNSLSCVPFACAAPNPRRQSKFKLAVIIRRMVLCNVCSSPISSLSSQLIQNAS